MIDITSRNLSNIEPGISFPKSETLESITRALEITTQELFANDHIKSNAELWEEISNLLETVKTDNKKLSRTYKILRDLIED